MPALSIFMSPACLCGKTAMGWVEERGKALIFYNAYQDLNPSCIAFSISLPLFLHFFHNGLCLILLPFSTLVIFSRNKQHPFLPFHFPLSKMGML
jgi:hypothetical protein